LSAAAPGDERPLRVGQSLELRLDTLAAGGDAVGREGGRVLFVPLGAPGDRVRVRVVELHKRFARAEIEAILEPGPGRREPPCPHFGTCGGCSWMHLDEPAQRAAREALLRDALLRIGGLHELPALEWIASPRALRYRSRARVAWEHGRIGFRARASHEVVDVEQCPVLDEPTQAQLAALRARKPKGRGEVEIRGFGARAPEAGLGLRVAPGAFFQANSALWRAWLDLVIELAGSGELAVELYAGVGFYTAAIERSFARVIAVERSRAARDLARNTRARVIEAAAEDWAKDGLRGLDPDAILLNPPRTGCDARVSEAIGRSAARRIIYVSCDPPTLARDLARIGDTFRLERLVLLDALPQTHHVESAALLLRV
jgi:23S rRNA (uracil1939-C5)-methyltransferase